jgi:hypothetical protein
MNPRGWQGRLFAVCSPESTERSELRQLERIVTVSLAFDVVPPPGLLVGIADQDLVVEFTAKIMHLNDDELRL